MAKKKNVPAGFVSGKEWKQSQGQGTTTKATQASTNRNGFVPGNQWKREYTPGTADPRNVFAPVNNMIASSGLPNYPNLYRQYQERLRQQRVLSQYQMNRMQPAKWMNGGPEAQLQAGLNRMQQAEEEQEQKTPGFQDWSAASNLLDPNSKVNALISQRPQEEQDYWQGVRQDIGKAMNKGKGNDRASQLLRPLTMEERLKQRQAQAESMMRVAQGTPINPLQNPRQYAQEVYDIRANGTDTSGNPALMNREQLEAWKKQNQRGLDQATRTDEQQARLHEMTEEAGEQNRIYYELNNRGLPVMQNMNGEPYVPDTAEWGGLDSTQFIRERPEEYYTDDSTKTEYDRMMYDAIHGKGAYDAILYADETTDEDIDAMDAEAERLWQQLESGNFNAEEQAAQENYYNAFNRENDNRTNGYQRNIDQADRYIENWDRIAELEAGAPEGEYKYNDELGNPNWTDWTDLNKMKIKDLYRYANMDLTDEDMTDVQRYGNLRPAQFMTDTQQNVFNGYVESGKYAEAQEYYNALEPYLLQMKNEYRTLLEQRMYNNGGAIPLTAYRILTKPVEGVAGLGLTAAGLLGNETALDTNSEWWDLSRTNQNIQNTSADAWARQAAEWFGGGNEGFAAQAGRFLNGVFFSMADNLTAFALSGGASKVSADAAQKLTQQAIQFIMSSEATAGTMFEQLEAGVDPTRAAIMSFGSGIIEAITEKYSLEQILDPDVRAVLGTKGAFMKYLGKASFAEGSEEIASDLLDTGLDFIMSAAYGDAPELIRNYEALIAEGMSEEEATRKVLGDYLSQLGSDGLAGALSGLLMSGSRGVQARGLDSYQTRSIGSTVVNRNVEEGMTAKEKSGEQYSNFMKLNDAAKMLQPGSEARRIAQEIEADVKKGGKVSMKKAGKLTRAIMQESNEQIGQVADAVLGDTLTQQLTGEGIAPEDAARYSDVLKNAVETGRMTPEAMLILSQDERARGLWSEIVKSEDVQSARAAQKSVMDLITTPGERAAESIRDSVASKMATARYITEKDAEMQEALAAGEQRTGSPLEVVADGKIGNVTGFGLKEIKGENGTTWAVTAKVETADGTIEVDLNDVLSTNERTAQVLQMVQAENGQSIGEHMTMQLLKIAQTTKDIAGAATDAISIAMDDLLGEKTKVTTLSKTEEQAMRAALEEDKKEANTEAAKNQKQLNPGKAKIVLNGVEYGSKKFAQELEKYGAQIRDEANYVAKLMKSIGMDVEFYYDNSEEGSARQGAFVGTQGIRLNLAGTFTSDGVHRSVVATAAHEATHWLRANAPEAYRQLQTYALKGLQNANVNVRNELRRIMDNYALYGEHLTMDKAAEEMTAMGCEEIFTNEQLVSDLQAEDPTLYGKVKQAVQHVMNLLRKVAGENMATSSRRYAQKLRGTLDQLAKVWKITYEAAKGATENALQKDMQASDGTETHYGDNQKFSMRVTDPQELSFLNNQDTVTTYKSMQLIDGKLYPPMAAVVAGNMEDHSELGQWEKATEHPELIKSGNKFTLNKGKGKGSLDAAYNPYMHSSNLMINDQFSGAYNRPNLVTVECEVPASELTSGYHAQYAKDAVGWHGWHTGPVASQLRAQKNTERQVMLSRWIKPVRIVSDAEVAQHYAELMKGTNIEVPDNVITPSLREELIKAGVKVKESGRVSYSLRDEDREYLSVVKMGRYDLAEKMVDEAAKKAGYTIKAYHGTPNGKFNTFEKFKIGTTTDFGKLGRGFYFTNEKQVADYYAGYLNDSTVIPVYLKMDNPFVLDRNYDNMSVKEFYDSILGKGGIVDEQRSEELTQWLIDNGYDGIVADGEYMVLDPKNIKSAETVTYDKYGEVIPLSERFRTDHEENWKDNDIRFSMRDEDYMAAANSGDVATAQRMVDEAAKAEGYTKKVYHGTPTGGFTVFRGWSYFTENKAYADRYNHASASSIRGSYETTTPQTYELYMNPGKVFDTRKAREKKLYNEARMEYGMGELTETDSGLPDWTNGGDLVDFIEERELDYDTIMLDEGADGGYGEEVVKRGISYLTRSNNVKSADPIVYDNNGNVIPLSERFNKKNPDIRFSMREPVEVRADGLIAVHNLGERQLISTMEEGGFSAPSVAVIRARMGHTKYGEISVVLFPNAIDPKKSVKNKVYGTDAWTPTRANAQIETKLNYETLQNARDKIEEALDNKEGNEWKYNAMNWINQWLYEDQTSDTLDDMIDRAYRNDGMIVAYNLQSGGKINKVYVMSKVHPEIHEEFLGLYNKFLDKLEEKGMLQEFVEDMATKAGQENFDKYLETFRESGEDAAKLVEIYDNKKTGLPKVVIYNRMKAAAQYQEDGREILRQEEYDKATTISELRRNTDKKGFGKWVENLLEGAFGEKGVYNGEDIFTRSGNKRSFRATHWEPTAENIVRAMYINHEEKGGEAGGATGLMAKASKEYGSLAEVRGDIQRLNLLEESEYKVKVEALDERINKFAEEVSKLTGESYYDVKEILIDAGGQYAKNPSRETIKRYMEKQGVKLTAEQLATAEQLMKEAQEIPTGYFEAKPMRVVGFDSIAKVIVPQDASQKLLDMMDERGIPYDTYDGTDEDRLRVLNEQENAMFSIRDDTDYDVRQWMETVPEWSLQTEAEKQLLSKYKSMQMKQRLDRERMRKIDSDLMKLEVQLTEERNGRIEAEETMENALESAGTSVREGHWLQKDGKIIGKINADGTISLNKGVPESVYQDLRAAGFGFKNKKGIFRPAMSAPQNADGKPTITALLGKSEAQRQRDALLKRKQDLQETMDEQEVKLAEITKDEGFGRMMYQQRKVLDELESFGTQQELMDYVARMEKKAQEVAARIEENRKATEALEKGGIVDKFRKLLGTTSAAKAAEELKHAYHSTWTVRQIQNYLDPIILKMKTGADFEQDVEDLAGVLVMSDARNADMDEDLRALRGFVIKVGEGQMRELKAQGSSLREIRSKLAGTGIKVVEAKVKKDADGNVVSREVSTLENGLDDAIEEYGLGILGELGGEKDALGAFVEKVQKRIADATYGNNYAQRISEAMAVITGKAAGAAKGIYMPDDLKAQKQVRAMMNFVKNLSAETAEAQKALADIAAQMGEMQKAGMAATNRATTLMRDVNVAIDYYQKIGKIAADEAKQKKQSAVIEQLKSKHAEEIVKNNEEWRALVQRDKDARAQLDENRKMTRQINTNLKRTWNLLKNPKGLQNIPEYMQGLAREVISKFVDNDLGRGARFLQATQKELAEYRRILDAWEKQNGKFDRNQLGAMDAENVKADVVLADLDKITEGMKQLNAWKIYGKNKLDALQQRGAIIEQIRDAVSEIYTAIRAEGEVQAGDRRVAVEDAAYEVAKGTGGKKYREWTGFMGQKMSWLHKAIVSGNMTPEYFFRTLGNKGLSDLWENYHWAENRNGLELKKAKDRLAQIAEEYGYKNWDMKQKIKLNLQSGEVEITLGQMMSLWATWQREKTLGPEMSSHLTHGGFYADVDLRDGLLGRATVEKRAHRVTEEDMDYVLTQLTVDQMNFIDAVVKFMSNDMSELGNAASMQAYGIKLYKESYYFPFQMWDGVKSRKSNDAGGAAAANDRAFHPSFSKSRQHGANNAVMIGDFMQVATDHIAGMINYATMGLANEYLQKVLNAQTAELYDTKRNTRALIEEAYGREAAKYLADLQAQLNGGAVRIEKTIYDKMISLFRKNAVAGSLSVALQQPLSYIRAAMMINPKYLTQAVMKEYWKGSYQELIAHSGVAVIKDMGKFDMNAGQTAREYLAPEGMVTKGKKVWTGIGDVATMLPERMDAWTWTRMWVAVKAEQHAEHPEMDMKSDEFLDMCAKRFNDIMRRTQVYDSTLVRSANMRSQNPFVKSVTSFMAEPTLTLNVLADSIRMAKEHEKGGAGMVGKAAATFLLSAVLQAAVKGLMGSGRNPDKKKTWLENFLYRFSMALMSEANPLSMIPGYSDMVTLLKEGKLEDDAMGAVGKLITAFRNSMNILSGESDNGLYRDMEDSVAQIVQIFTNIPAKNLMRDGRAMWNWFIEKPYAQRESDMAVIRYQTEQAMASTDSLLSALLKDAGFKTTNAAYYERIYQAKKAGDDKAAQDMIDYLLHGKGVKQEDINSGVTKAAKADDSISVDEKTEMLGGDDATWWKLDRDAYKKETGKDVGTGYYYRLADAINSRKSDAIKAAVKQLKDHGISNDKIKGKLSDWKKEYLNANGNEKIQLKNALIMAYKALGYSDTEANEIINKWK